METAKNPATAVKKTPENLAVCVCAKCPSYNDCSRGQNELLFCSAEVGKSACPYEMKGCICGPCPVHRANGLTDGYYCYHG